MRLTALILFCCIGYAPCSEKIDWSLISGTDSMDLYVKGMEAGSFVTSTGYRDGDSTGYNSLSFSVKAGGRVVTSYEEEWLYTPGGKVKSGYSAMRSPSGVTERSIKRLNDTLWEISTRNAGGVTRKETDIAPASILSYYRNIKKILSGDITEGDTLVDSVFIFGLNENITTEYVCDSVTEEDTYWFRGRDRFSGMDQVWVVDSSGRTVQESVDPEFTAVKRGRDPGELSGEEFSLERLNTSFKIDKGAPEGKGIEVVFQNNSGVDSSVSGFYKPTDQGYLLNDITLDCPFKGGVEAGPDTESAVSGEWLESTDMLQSSHPDIKSLSEELMDRSGDLCSFISASCRYVFENTEKEHIGSLSNGVETLKSGKGDCTEHAVLLSSLLRSSGVGAGVAAGLVYVPEREAFLFHAWTVVKGDKGFSFADPALNRFPADKGYYIPFVIFDDSGGYVSLSRYASGVEINYR